MFVKVITKYKDTQFAAELPAGVILEVSDDRASALIKAKVAEEFIFPAVKATKKNNKSEEPKVEEVQEPTVEEAVQETESPAEDTWKEPEATETTGE